MSASATSARSKGLLTFANSTPDVDYLGMAEKTMRMASDRLGLPYTIVTSQQSADNRRRDIDSGKIVPWKNLGRWSAYELSPYDETILLDADYLVLTDRLLGLFESPAEYLICHNNHFLGDVQTKRNSSYLDPVWATVLFFRKSHKAQMLFDLVKRIEKNYGYYRWAFNVLERNYRNDYAFSMADLMLNGHTRSAMHRMPWGITTIDMPNPVIEYKDNWLVVRGPDCAHVLPCQDLHVMSKTWFANDGIDRLEGRA